MKANVHYTQLHKAVCSRIEELGQKPELVLARINAEIDGADTDDKHTKAKVAVKSVQGKAVYATVRTAISNKSAKLTLTPALRIAEISDMCFDLAEKFCRVENIRLPQSAEDWLQGLAADPVDPDEAEVDEAEANNIAK